MKLPSLRLELPMGGNLEAEEKDKIKREKIEETTDMRAEIEEREGINRAETRKIDK